MNSGNILITGAGGYIGSVLTRMALEKGYSVKALDRFFFGKETLPQKNKQLEIIEDDIRNVTIDIMDKTIAVIDLAAFSNDPSGEIDPSITNSINYRGRLGIARLAKTAGVKKYILPSSCSIYGYQDGIIDETSEVRPLTTYAKANYALENDLIDIADSKFCVVILRLATVYGKSFRMRFDLAINGMTKDFISKGKIRILKDGNQWRPFVHIRDACRAMLACLDAKPAVINRQIFNVGCNEQNFRIFDLAERVAAAIGKPFDYEWYGEPDHRSYHVNFNKISRTLDFVPGVDVEEGVREISDGIVSGELDISSLKTITVAWYKKIIEDGVVI